MIREASEGSLYRYVKDEGKLWHLVGQSIPIVVGSRGLGWGRGLHGALLGEGPVKEEGDGRDLPQGPFTLDKLLDMHYRAKHLCQTTISQIN